MKVTITGEKVQDIGYRVILLTSALNFGINKFYAYNASLGGEQAVVTLIGAEKETITYFYNYIKENIPEEAIVSDIKIEEFKGNVMDIDRYLHLIQVEQLNKGIPAILDIRNNTTKMLDKQDKMLDQQDKMLDQQDKMLEKQDRMLDKQDTSIRLLQDVKQDTSDMRSGFTDLKKEIRTGLNAVKEEIHLQRDDFREVFMHEVSELKVEIAEVKCTLARMQAEA